MAAFFESLRAEASDPSARGALQSIVDGALAAVQLRSAFASTEMDALVRGLEARGAALPEHPFSTRFLAWSRGWILDHCDDDLVDYYSSATAVRTFIDGVIPEFEQRYLNLLRHLAGDKPVLVPSSERGERYACFTLRRFPDGGLIPPHCELVQLDKPGFRSLRKHIDERTILSVLLSVQQPAGGGELMIYDLGPDHPSARDIYRNAEHMDRPLDGWDRVALSPDPGTLTVFDGGRRFHQVLPVVGSRDRHTAGGFLAAAKDGSCYFTWS